MRKVAFALFLPYLAIAYGFVIPLWDYGEALGSLARVAGTPAAFAWLLTIIQEGRIRRPSGYLWAVFAFFAWSMITIFWSVSPDSTMFNVQRYVIYAGTTLMLWDMVRTRENIRGVLMAFVAAGCAISIALFLNAAASNETFNGRFSAFGLHPNMVPRILGMLFPMSWCLALYLPVRSYLLRAFFFAFPIIATVAMLLTGSRGGLVSCLPAFIYLLITLPRIGRRGLVGLATIGIPGALFALTRLNLSTQLERLATIFGGRSNSYDTGDLSSGRVEIWEAGFKVVQKHFATGVGAGAYPEATRFEALPRGADGSPLVAHNTYLSVTAETGIIGTTLFITIFLYVIGALRKMPPGWKAAWVSIFLVWVVGATTGTWEINAQTYLVMTTLVASGRVFQEEARAAAGVDREEEPATPEPTFGGMPVSTAS